METYWIAVTDIAEMLEAAGTLTGAEIDQTIAGAIAWADMIAEMERRADMLDLLCLLLFDLSVMALIVEDSKCHLLGVRGTENQ